VPVSTLKDLEKKLDTLSHSEAAIAEVEAFSRALSNTRERLGVFNADGAIVRAPILFDEARSLGFDNDDDAFTVLQADIVSTEAAFYLGERVTQNPKYMILNSSCDLVPNRRQCAALLRITSIRQSDRDWRATLALLLKFSKRESMYLPVLPGDAPDVLCNVVQFDGICQIRSTDLLLANRIASLSLVGWRIFASFSRTVIVRATNREVQIRMAIDGRPEQQAFTTLDNDPAPSPELH
jgi:hypothetical protein